MTALPVEAPRRSRRRASTFFYALGRFILVGVVTFLGLIAVTFFIGRVVPIDPVLAIVGDRASQSTYDAARKLYGLDLPLAQQFLLYLKKALTGDFGVSILSSNPVLQDIRRVFPATLELATVGTLIGLLFGIPLGVLAAVKRGSFVDQAVRVVGLIGYSIPIFWLGLMGLLIFYARLDWVAGPGRIDIAYEYTFTPITGLFLLDAAMQRQWDAFWDIFRHIILPASLLGYFSMAYISRMTRSFMLNELGQEYIVAARAKGLSETAHHLGPRAAQCRRAAGDGDRTVLRDAARRLSFDRDDFRLAGHRTISDQLAAERRHERRARCDDRHRRGVHRAQPAVGFALPSARSKDASDDALARGLPAGPPRWLLSERPASRMQARLGRAYMTWRRFSANRLALVGLAIIICLFDRRRAFAEC